MEGWQCVYSERQTWQRFCEVRQRETNPVTGNSIQENSLWPAVAGGFDNFWLEVGMKRLTLHQSSPRGKEGETTTSPVTWCFVVCSLWLSWFVLVSLATNWIHWFLGGVQDQDSFVDSLLHRSPVNEGLASQLHLLCHKSKSREKQRNVHIDQRSNTHNKVLWGCYSHSQCWRERPRSWYCVLDADIVVMEILMARCWY